MQPKDDLRPCAHPLAVTVRMFIIRRLIANEKAAQKKNKSCWPMLILHSTGIYPASEQYEQNWKTSNGSQFRVFFWYFPQYPSETLFEWPFILFSFSIKVKKSICKNLKKKWKFCKGVAWKFFNKVHYFKILKFEYRMNLAKNPWIKWPRWPRSDNYWWS